MHRCNTSISLPILPVTIRLLPARRSLSPNRISSQVHAVTLSGLAHLGTGSHADRARFLHLLTLRPSTKRGIAVTVVLSDSGDSLAGLFVLGGGGGDSNASIASK